MATSVVMPALEMAQETGKIVSWVKKEGEQIRKGEILLEVETDKAVVEIEASADGVLGGVKSQAGDVVPVGTTIAWILAPGEQVPAEAASAAPAARTMTEQPRPATTAPSSTSTPRSSTAPTTSGEIQISPKARRLAKELGVDTATVRGTGPDGTITSDDISAAAAAPKTTPAAAPAAAAAAGSPLSTVARLMAERTTQSWTQVPHFFLVRDFEADALIALREKLGAKVVTHTDLLVAITARVLVQHPKLNASRDNGNIRMNPEINVSVAMAVQDGVVGAVIPNADKTAVNDIATLRKELTERARG